MTSWFSDQWGDVSAATFLNQSSNEICNKVCKLYYQETNQLDYSETRRAKARASRPPASASPPIEEGEKIWTDSILDAWNSACVLPCRFDRVLNVTGRAARYRRN